MNKVKIALVFEDKRTAERFILENASCGKVHMDSQSQFVYETSLLRFDWIKPFTNVKGLRINYVYTTEEIRDTDWFDTVIRPMQMVGTGIIDQEY